MLYMSLLDRGDLWYSPHSNSIPIDRLLAIEPQIHQKFADLSTNGTVMLKRIRPQKRIDPFRKYFRSQALREYRSTLQLRKLGINVPTPLAYGTNLSPFGKYESILIMEYIPNIGTMREVMAHEANQRVRTKLLKKLGADLQRMMEARLYHKDAHLGNILVTPDYDLVWIDNDLSPIKGPDELKRLLKKFRATPLLTEEEKSAFLPDHLPG